MIFNRSVLVRLVLAVATIGFPGSAAAADELIDAVKARNRQAVQRLAAKPGAVQAREADGTTALHWAVWNDEGEIANLLLRSGADANAANRYGVTPLAVAVLNGSAAVTKLLLEANANPNAPLAEGQTILMAAARAGNPIVIQLLLEAGAAVNAREQVLGETALMWAALENHPNAILLLARYGAELDAPSTVMQPPRFKFGDGIVARPTVLAKGGWTPLMYAARQNGIHAVRALADAGANLNLTDPDGTTALVFAIINAHYDVAAALLEKGADPNIADLSGMAALYAAVDMHTLDDTVGRPNPRPHSTIDVPELVTVLLDRGADPNARLKSPVLERVHNDGDPNLAEGATPLMRAAKDADVALMRLLVARGANVNLRTKTQRTPLMFAAARLSGFRGSTNRGSEEAALAAITLCLDNGADVNAVDEGGQSALHLAAAQAEDSVIRLLAARGADPHLRDKRGRTPLEVASAGGRGGRGAAPSRIALLKEVMAQGPQVTR
jgi:ankyrin repeat protein